MPDITITHLPEGILDINPAQFSKIIIKLLRPQDLLSLELRFTNFVLQGNELIKKADPALMMVVFQPQSIAEQCGTEEATNFKLPDLPAKMLISGESRLVFKINKNLKLDVNELMDWGNFDLVVNERAKGVTIITPSQLQHRESIDAFIQISGVKPVQINSIRGLSKDEKTYLKQHFYRLDLNVDTPNVLHHGEIPVSPGLSPGKVSPPAEWETSLEIPMRLYLSPTQNAGWKHEKKLISSQGVINKANLLFELWHSRMGTKTSLGVDDSDLTFEERVLRILWGERIDKDYRNIPTKTINELTDNFLGNTSFNDFFRHQLVHESSNFQIPGFTPEPVRAYKLFLTTLGAYLDSIFTVERSKLDLITYPSHSKRLGLLKWRHIQTLAREHYVELVEAGNIMPFGHQAVLITITERKPHLSSGTATNFKRELVVITEPVKYYNYRHNGEFMNFCFSKVEMITTASPLLDAVKQGIVDPATIVTAYQFVIRSNNSDVLFKIRAEDLNGNPVNFSIPLVFVSYTILPDNAGILAHEYSKGVAVNSTANLNGQKCSLAPQETNGCDTAFAAYDMRFGAKEYAGPDELQGFLPTLENTTIIEPSYQRLTGSDQKVTVSLVDDSNHGHVFAQIAENLPKPSVTFGNHAEKTGGFAVPNFNLTGLSKAVGAFGGDLQQFKDAAATASSFFDNVTNPIPDPLLFGVFKLSEILNFADSDPITNLSAYDLSKPLLNRVPRVPNLTTEETKDEIITSYVIKTNLEDFEIPDVVSFTPTKKDGFTIVTQAIIKKGDLTAVPSFSTNASIKPFSISLLGNLFTINFKSIVFTADAGKSADINVEFEDKPKYPVVFGGCLGFINKLRDWIPFDGFSDPPIMDVTTNGVKCGYSLSIPNIELGAFMLANVSMAAEVNLPFTGAPLTMAFRFCEKQQPFVLIISILGGGGYFGLEADLNGLRQIDAALEFGAACDLNLGVASGSVSIMAGIYYKMEMANGNNTTKLNGFLRINGSMSIIGLITASVELYMALTWLVEKGKVFGEASVSIKVEILFFSKTVSVHTSRTFSGSGNDPNFKQTYSPAKWLEYCEAFAA